MTTARLIRRFYEIGVYPDWWKLEPMVNPAAWQNAVDAIEAHDAHTRGIVALGLDPGEDALASCFAVAAQFPLVRCFAVGRTIFADAARDWLAGQIGDDAAVAQMAARYHRLCAIWDGARGAAPSGRAGQFTPGYLAQNERGER